MRGDEIDGDPLVVVVPSAPLDWLGTLQEFHDRLGELSELSLAENFELARQGYADERRRARPQRAEQWRAFAQSVLNEAARREVLAEPDNEDSGARRRRFSRIRGGNNDARRIEALRAACHAPKSSPEMAWLTHPVMTPPSAARAEAAAIAALSSAVAVAERPVRQPDERPAARIAEGPDDN
jgi:hypothetical protein